MLIRLCRWYYRYDPLRLATCPVTVHALLHIADSILAVGPVWASWAFPTERYCGKLMRAISSRRWPFENLDRFVLHDAVLTHAKAKFRHQLGDELVLSRPVRELGESVSGCELLSHPCIALRH
jgi:hypothetical protein